MAGIVTGLVLIVALAIGCHYLMRWLWSDRNPAWELVREAEIDVIARREMANLDREYEELLREAS